MRTKKTTLLLLKILEKAVSDSSLHSRFLNTLSYLEYIGSRKMMKSLPSQSLNKFFLDHIHEEIRHSLLLKGLAQKLAQKNLSFKKHEMIAGTAASHYFQEVDHYSIKFAFSNTILNYLYTTYAIEQRALIFYSLYNDILQKKYFSFSVKSILKDEKEHLAYVEKKIKTMDPLWENNLDEITEFEHQKYFSLLIELEKDIFYPDLIPFHPIPQANPSYYKI